MPPLKIILFEDSPEERAKLLLALKQEATSSEQVVSFEKSRVSETSSEQSAMYEARIAKILSTPPFDGATLILADRDLSRSHDVAFSGLSVNAVAAAAKQLGIPICSYARNPNLDDYEWRGRWEEGHIVVHFSHGEQSVARTALLAARGFREIAERLPDVLADKSRNTPAKILASLLGKPEYSDKIGLYGVGDQGRLTEALTGGKHSGDRVRRMSHFLGYWLWASLLRYPGVLVNQVAAASYLNIETTDFEKPEVQEFFNDALYKGPFSELQPQWWRGVLDDIVARQDCADGLEVVSKVVSGIERSHCSVDPDRPAGYYCVISRKPVSLENSRGGLSWFPRGADLTRISEPKFEEYGPWLGA